MWQCLSQPAALTIFFIFSSSIIAPGCLHSGFKEQRHAWQGAAIPTAVKLSSERSPSASPALSNTLRAVKSMSRGHWAFDQCWCLRISGLWQPGAPLSPLLRCHACFCAVIDVNLPRSAVLSILWVPRRRTGEPLRLLMLLQRLAIPAKLYYRLSLARGEIIMHVLHSRYPEHSHRNVLMLPDLGMTLLLPKWMWNISLRHQDSKGNVCWIAHGHRATYS